MRLVLLAVLPVMLAACDGGPVDPDARMPTPHAEGSDGSVSTPITNQYAVTTIEASEADGEWSSARIGGDSSVVFTDTEGNEIAAVSCKQGSGDAQNAVLFHRFVSFDDAGEGISIYTSSGAKSYGIVGDNPVTVTVGQNDPFAIMLGSAQGDIRVATGDLTNGPDVVTFPTSAAVRTLVNDCRGVDYSTPEPEEATDEDETEEE